MAEYSDHSRERWGAERWLKVHEIVRQETADIVGRKRALMKGLVLDYCTLNSIRNSYLIHSDSIKKSQCSRIKMEKKRPCFRAL